VPWILLQRSLKGLDRESVKPEALRIEIGLTLFVYADHTSMITPDTAETLVQILEWLTSQEDGTIPKSSTLLGISSSSSSLLLKSVVLLVLLARMMYLGFCDSFVFIVYAIKESVVGGRFQKQKCNTKIMETKIPVY
jgi:hypothetical protein